MNKVIYYKKYGSFKLQKSICDAMGADEQEIRHSGICRHDKKLVALVEEYLSKVDEDTAELAIEEIDEDKYWIIDNDGMEIVCTPETIPWVEIRETMIFRRYISTAECSIYPVDINFSSLHDLFEHEYFHKEVYSLTHTGFVKFKNFIFSRDGGGYLLFGSVKPSDEHILNDMDIIKSKGIIFISSSKSKHYDDYDELKTILESLGDFINFNDKECTK